MIEREFRMSKCKVCGTKVGDNDTKCPMCGTLLNVTLNSTNLSPKHVNTSINNYPPNNSIPMNSDNRVQSYVSPVKPQLSSSGRDATDDELEDAYISGNVGRSFRSSAYIHYKTAFEKFENGQEVSFSYRYGLMINLPYRKHYMRGFFLGFFFWILWIPFCLTRSKKNKLIYGAGVGATLATSMMNNDWYVFNRYKKIAYNALRKFPCDSDRQLSYVAKKGGTNFLAALIFVLFVSIPLIFFIYICYWIFQNGLC